MKSRVALGLACCILGALSMSCMRGPLTWQRVTLNDQIAQEDVAFIEEGRTRLMDVADRLGPPDEIQAAGESLIARYHFSDGRYFRADYGWGLRFVLPFMAPELVLGGGGFGTNTFQVVCDDQWVVHEHAFAWHADSSEFRFWPFGDTAR